MTIVLEARGVTKRFGAQVVVDAMSFAIRAGTLTAIVGRSGSGKTTLLSMLAGFSRADAGSLEGVSERWADTAIVPQTLGLVPELTAVENTAAPLLLAAPRTSRQGAARVAIAVLDELGVGEAARRRVAEMSMGQGQRVAVARALVVSPRLLLADEPTSHLDADAAALVVAALTRRVASGMAAVIVTHDDRVRAVADEVIELAP